MGTRETGLPRVRGIGESDDCTRIAGCRNGGRTGKGGGMEATRKY